MVHYFDLLLLPLAQAATHFCPCRRRVHLFASESLAVLEVRQPRRPLRRDLLSLVVLEYGLVLKDYEYEQIFRKAPFHHPSPLLPHYHRPRRGNPRDVAASHVMPRGPLYVSTTTSSSIELLSRRVLPATAAPESSQSCAVLIRRAGPSSLIKYAVPSRTSVFVVDKLAIHVVDRSSVITFLSQVRIKSL
uniref:Secreted protein n=1 Tax=Mycena chlorophos TaxID=658473 RepID=A0ABQ0L538_MYCCL|nr:predicted protein [Mycena chlorophos]